MENLSHFHFLFCALQNIVTMLRKLFGQKQRFEGLAARMGKWVLLSIKNAEKLDGEVVCGRRARAHDWGDSW